MMLKVALSGAITLDTVSRAKSEASLDAVSSLIHDLVLLVSCSVLADIRDPG